MSEEIQSQTMYWNAQANAFQSIYSHQKPGVANFLDRVFRKDMYERFAFTIDHSAPIEGRTFLDVGCGSGLYSIEFAKKGAAQVIGIDIAENMLQLCSDSATQAGVGERCRFIHTDLLEFNPNATFDVSIGIGLFDYIRDPMPVLKKMRRVTKDRVIVSFPRFWTWRAPIRKVRLTLQNCAVYFYTARRVAALMKDAGFARHTIVQVGKLHCVVGFSSESVVGGKWNTIAC